MIRKLLTWFYAGCISFGITFLIWLLRRRRYYKVFGQWWVSEGLPTFITVGLVVVFILLLKGCFYTNP